MARLQRYALPGQPLHVIQRGNNRTAIFRERVDYQAFREFLGTAIHKHNCRVHAYVLMTNHVHLLMSPGSDSAIGKVMQSVGRRYVRYYNDSYRRTGTLWEGRYRATPIDCDRYMLTCYRYIELNPVRAGQVIDPGDYAWSSYRANAYGERDGIITPHPLFVALGADSNNRCAAYRALFLAPLGSGVLETIRESTNKGWALGSDQFRAELSAHTPRRPQPIPRGRKPRGAQEIGV